MADNDERDWKALAISLAERAARLACGYDHFPRDQGDLKLYLELTGRSPAIYTANVDDNQIRVHRSQASEFAYDGETRHFPSEKFVQAFGSHPVKTLLAAIEAWRKFEGREPEFLDGGDDGEA